MKEGAALVAAGQSVGAAAPAILMKEVLMTMWMTKLKGYLAAGLVAVLLGVGVLSYRAVGQGSQAGKPEPARPLTEMEELRREIDILKLQVELLQNKVRTQGVEIHALKEGRGAASVPPPARPPRSDRNVRYLSDMDEFDVKVTEGPPGVLRFAKKGNLGYGEGDPRYGFGHIRANGKESPNGLSMCPDSDTYARVKYRLGKTAKTFLTSVALNDSAGGAGRPPGEGRIPTPLTFQVLGDGKVLWKSKPVDIARNVQECRVDVSGVEVLELRIVCPGSGVNAQAVWLEPRLLLK
jgi:hypothetical protein